MLLSTFIFCIILMFIDYEREKRTIKNIIIKKLSIYRFGW